MCLEKVLALWKPGSRTCQPDQDSLYNLYRTPIYPSQLIGRTFFYEDNTDEAEESR
jgi:hypothetical protein